ncbi:MAG: ABC transporter substrate-binding protein [Planctomycetaceae bacterium]|nr:ABC transporter substrate-binding protein [Planctomycetaceae bacterium]
MPSNPNSSGREIVVVICVLLTIAAGYLMFSSGSGQDDALVVYCAHDSVFSERVLRKFEQDTGIKLKIRFDTEATKSLGLVNQLVREKDHPRCDVFWNNQVLGTMQIQEQGILLPYQGSGFDRIPDGLKDPDGHWVGFGARLRVYIVNTDKMEATEAAVAEAEKGNLSRMAIAKPLYGTTLSHFSLMWQQRGEAGMKKWHADLRKRDVQVVNGNATVKNLVADGVCDWGWTDTDDYFVAADDNKPVTMLPIRVADGKTICMPNSVAIIRGTPRLTKAQRLVDFLLSEENEIELAKSKARQIPLGPVDETQLSEDVRKLKTWAADAYDITGLSAARMECLNWLKSEYLQ